MNALAIAGRNLLRNRRRSTATLLAMTLGGLCVLIFGGYVQNIVFGLQTGYIRGGGHLQLQHRDYFLFGSGDPASYAIADYRRIMDRLVRDPGLAPLLSVVTPTLEFGGIAGNFDAGVSRTVLASGVVVAEQNSLRRWNEYGFPDEPSVLALTGTLPDAAVIGVGVARVLRLCALPGVDNCRLHAAAGSPTGEALPPEAEVLARGEEPPSAATPRSGTIELLAATTHGAPNVVRLEARAERQGVKELDDLLVSLHLDQAQRLLYGSAPPQVTAIVVQLQHTAQIPAARARLNQLIAAELSATPLAVQDFRTLNPYYGQTVALFRAIFGFIAVLIAAIVLFTVSNTMSAAVVERTVEIGTLRAMGCHRAGIRHLFLCEGLLLGLCGASFALLAGLGFAAFINRSGLSWTPPGRIDPVGLHVEVWGQWEMLAGTTLGILGVALASAGWPAWRAARLEVVEALRHV